jgi:hypothetical protein
LLEVIKIKIIFLRGVQVKLFSVLVLTILLSSCSGKNKVYIIKQWHLSPSESTIDILKAKDLPQYEHQLDVYQKAIDLIEKKSRVVIAEGCEGEINEAFVTKFNGWDMASLTERRELSDYELILAPAPMKIKAKYQDKIKVICGDNEELIKANNLAFSDMKAFSSFFQRFIYYQNQNQEAFNKYLKAYKELVTLKQADDPILDAKNRATESMNKFKQLIESRNTHFLKAIVENQKMNPVLIVGGLHVYGIEKFLKENKIDYEIIEPFQYPLDELKLYVEIENILNTYTGKAQILYYQVPEGFDPHKLPMQNLIPRNKIASVKEWQEFEILSKRHNFPIDLLRLDMDKDGIRDFTIATSIEQVVITAEDDDWDNDGVANLLDAKLFNQEMFKVNTTKSPVENKFGLSEGDEKEILTFFKTKNIALLESDQVRHELLLLKILMEVMKKTIELPHLKILHATKPKVVYGKQVFFSYVPSSKSMEIYPNELFQYLSYKKEKEFDNVPTKQFVTGFLTPLVIHSFAHELAHSILEFDVMGFAKKNKWTWKEEAITTPYLSKNRQSHKVISQNYYDYKFEDISYKQWLEEHQRYVTTINDLLKTNKGTDEFIQAAKELKWHLPTQSSAKEMQLSFLVSHNIPSLYAMSQPREWYAELVASCIFLKFYPKAREQDEAIRYEHLIGLNPKVAPEEFCKFF